MSLWPPAPEPESPLARYRILSPTASVRVSPLCLGTMNIGENKWEAMVGKIDKEGSLKMLDAFYDAGGNFIDTANNYQDGTSEMLIGEWMEKRGIRDQLVIATKYSSNLSSGDKSTPIQVNYTGNSVKSMHISIEASLKKLRTAYIDIFYVHWWDHTATVEEVMNALHNLVIAGKVLYLGISDAPAWVVVKANQYAKYTGKTPFVIYQGMWNLKERSFERDIIPMARSEGLALAPWSAVGGGRFRTDAEEERRRETGEKGREMGGPGWERTEEEKKVCKALEEVSKEVGVEHITSVALAYVMHKFPFVYPIVGGRKVEHLQANVDALRISLSEEQIKSLESALPLDPGFPNWFIGDGATHPWIIQTAGYLEQRPTLKPIPAAPRATPKQ